MGHGSHALKNLDPGVGARFRRMNPNLAESAAAAVDDPDTGSACIERIESIRIRMILPQVPSMQSPSSAKTAGFV